MWTLLMALFIRKRTNMKLQSEQRCFFFLLWHSQGETLAGKSVQCMRFPHPRSKLVQRALSAWNTLLVRGPDLIASFGVGLLGLRCCFLQPDILLLMWPYPFTSRMPFLMITNIIFMTFMCCKATFLFLFSFTHGSRGVCRLIASSLSSSVSPGVI